MTLKAQGGLGSGPPDSRASKHDLDSAISMDSPLLEA